MTSLRKTWIIANSLLLSQLRATAVRAGSRISCVQLSRRPLILGIIDVVGFSLAIGITYYIGSSIASSPPSTLVTLVSNGVRSIIVILPAVILSIILVLGLVIEVSSGAQFASL